MVGEDEPAGDPCGIEFEHVGVAQDQRQPAAPGAPRVQEARHPAVEKKLPSDGGPTERAAITGEPEVGAGEAVGDGVPGDDRVLHGDRDPLAGERVDAGGVPDGEHVRRGDRRRG